MKAIKFLQLNKQRPEQSQPMFKTELRLHPLKHFVSQLGDTGIQLLRWGVTHPFKFHSPMPKRVHLPFPSPFSTIYFAASGAGTDIHSVPLTKAGVPQGSCNSPVHHPSKLLQHSQSKASSEANSSEKRWHNREQPHSDCNSHLPRCGSHSRFRSSWARGSRSYTLFKNQTKDTFLYIPA